MDVYIEWTRKEIEEATRGATPEALKSAPAGKWSAAQVLEHLLITYRTSTKLFERLRTTDEKFPPQNLKQQVGTFLITVVGYFPGGRKSPEFAVPTGSVDPQSILQDIYLQLERMDAALRELEAVKGRSGPIGTHPVLGPLTPGQWRRFHHCHTRHHMKQVQERAGVGR